MDLRIRIHTKMSRIRNTGTGIAWIWDPRSGNTYPGPGGKTSTKSRIRNIVYQFFKHMTVYPVPVRKKTLGSVPFSFQEEWIVPVSGISFLKILYINSILEKKKKRLPGYPGSAIRGLRPGRWWESQNPRSRTPCSGWWLYQE